MASPEPTYRLHEPLPALDAPVLVVMLTGWIDASGAAAAAMATVEEATSTRPVATFNGDVFLDYRARRPTMELREGVNTRLDWPEIVLRVGQDAAGHDVLLLTGPEPDASWRWFADVVAGLSVELGVRLAVVLGAYPFASPHTRPSRLSCTSPSAELVESVPFIKNSVDVPAGMGAVLEHALVDRGVPAIGLWAQVPHYLATMSYPAASAALLDGLAQLTAIRVDTGALLREAEVQRGRIDQLVAANTEHQAMIEQLEAAYDQIDQPGGTMWSGSIPTADELGAEVERFLREQGD
ncbi:MAG: PAC2 family protein [Actinobacteria bacterium]|nr:PAC2 family protein [Actinomycetota bacterium]